MKTFTLILSLLISIMVLKAQDYQISFEGTGESTVVETVQVQNLTQGTSLTLNGSEVLHLMGIVGIGQVDANGDNSLRIYPNPMATNSKVEFEIPTSGKVIIDLYDITGKNVVSTQKILQAGTQTFNISGLTSGIYYISINSGNIVYSGKIISNCTNTGTAKISFVNSTIQSDNSIFKSSKSLVQMQYNEDDLLLFKAISGKYTTISTLIPVASATVIFNFVAATDYDNNDYATVTIGTQVWMAEDLRVTRYPNGDSIPNVTRHSTWVNLGDNNASDAYCFYDNNDSVGFGALYSYAAAIADDWTCDLNINQGVCPDGWHLPTDAEWTELTNYYSGGELKETDTLHWSSPNLGATNESGFTALPNGYRSFLDGGFSSFGLYTYWWSADEFGSTSAWTWYLSYNNTQAFCVNNPKSYGFSVRCIKD